VAQLVNFAARYSPWHVTHRTKSCPYWGQWQNSFGLLWVRIFTWGSHCGRWSTSMEGRKEL